MRSDGEEGTVRIHHLLLLLLLFIHSYIHVSAHCIAIIIIIEA